MTTALVVRDDYWRMHINNQLKLSGADTELDNEQIDKINEWVKNVAEITISAIEKVCEAFIEFARTVCDLFKPAFESLKELFDKINEVEGYERIDIRKQSIRLNWKLNNIVYQNKMMCQYKSKIVPPVMNIPHVRIRKLP
ncbi:MAG: hypothetical protein PHN69_05400 [Candidatus Pacebacteria bacterium]|nr:hypothetical protein [Candidatus Paceibacterota bacterium]